MAVLENEEGIDGVLNKHREHFCKLLLAFTGKQLNPNTILKIPVHEDPIHGVTDSDEKTVFDKLQYWIDMPVAENAGISIKRLRNGLKLKIHIFTYRSSPSLRVRQNEAGMKEWKDAALRAYKQSNFFLPRVLCIISKHQKLHRFSERIFDRAMLVRMRLENSQKIGIRPIDILTKCWLQKKGIEYDTITIEKGSEDASDPRGHFRNRFYISRKKKIKFFVEDDPEKAIKLAYICDVVFLMEQSYNINEKLPNNVVRVCNWDDVYRQARKYS